MVRGVRSQAKPAHRHPLEARRALNVCSCPAFALDRRPPASPDDPCDIYNTYTSTLRVIRRLGEGRESFAAVTRVIGNSLVHSAPILLQFEFASPCSIENSVLTGWAARETKSWRLHFLGTDRETLRKPSCTPWKSLGPVTSDCPQKELPHGRFFLHVSPR